MTTLVQIHETQNLIIIECLSRQKHKKEWVALQWEDKGIGRTVRESRIEEIHFTYNRKHLFFELVFLVL